MCLCVCLINLEKNIFLKFFDLTVPVYSHYQLIITRRYRGLKVMLIPSTDSPPRPYTNRLCPKKKKTIHIIAHGLYHTVACCRRASNLLSKIAFYLRHVPWPRTFMQQRNWSIRERSVITLVVHTKYNGIVLLTQNIDNNLPFTVSHSPKATANRLNNAWQKCANFWAHFLWHPINLTPCPLYRFRHCIKERPIKAAT